MWMQVVLKSLPEVLRNPLEGIVDRIHFKIRINVECIGFFGPSDIICITINHIRNRYHKRLRSIHLDERKDEVVEGARE